MEGLMPTLLRHFAVEQLTLFPLFLSRSRLVMDIGHIEKVINSLPRAARRKGDNDVAIMVINELCRGWDPIKKAKVTEELRTKVKSVLRNQRLVKR